MSYMARPVRTFYEPLLPLFRIFSSHLVLKSQQGNGQYGAARPDLL
jgi:hypothetical protein